MTSFLRSRLAGAACLSLLLPLESLADPGASRRVFEPYLGGSAGWATAGTGYVLPSGSTVTRESSSAAGGALFAGARFGPYFGAELSSLALGELGVDATAPGPTVNGVRRLNVTTLNLVGFLPLGSRWELAGRLGFALNASYRTGETCYSTSRRSGPRTYPCERTSWLFGLGARYALDEDWGLRLDWLYLDYQDSREGLRYKPHFVGAGVDYRF